MEVTKYFFENFSFYLYSLGSLEHIYVFRNNAKDIYGNVARTPTFALHLRLALAMALYLNIMLPTENNLDVNMSVT